MSDEEAGVKVLAGIALIGQLVGFVMAFFQPMISLALTASAAMAMTALYLSGKVNSR